MSKIIVVAKREYLKVIRKPSFWLSTLFFPIFIIAVSVISGLSSSNLENTLKNGGDSTKPIAVLDQSNFVHVENLGDKIIKAPTVDEGIQKVVSGEAEAFIYYPVDLETKKDIKIYLQDKGVLLQSRFNQFAETLLKNSILNELNDAQKIKAFNESYNYSITTYKDGDKVDAGFQVLIVPGISIILYFMLTTFATSYLLLSVAEEKENRVMEIVLSSIKPSQLITGKIIGLLGIIFTQVILLILLSIVGLLLTATLLSKVIPGAPSFTQIDLSILNLDTGKLLGQVALGVFYTVTGFFILACTMVGAGAAAPTYREAQGLSTIFIMTSVIPFYFITTIITDPSGTLARILSYFPYTAAFVLLFRNALGSLSLQEVIISGLILLLFCYIALKISFKLFEFGSLEYSKKISFKEFIASLR